MGGEIEITQNCIIKNTVLMPPFSARYSVKRLRRCITAGARTGAEVCGPGITALPITAANLQVRRPS